MGVVSDETARDAIQGVAGTAAMAKRVLLDAAADLVDAGVREADHVPVVDHERGMPEVDAHRSGVPAVRVQRDDANACQPRRALREQTGILHRTRPLVGDHTG